MAVAQASSSHCISLADLRCSSSPGRVSTICQLPVSNYSGRIGTNFTCGSPLLIRGTHHQKTLAPKATGLCIRCEQTSKEGSGLDVWLGRLAMIGFAAAISVEIATGKGLLENFGLTSPLPTVALAVTALVGVLTAVFIFQSASDN